jgi:hypothetical protein
MSEPKPELNCDLVERELFELRDGGEYEAIRSHLAICSRCKALADWDRRFADSLRAESPDAPSSLSSIVQDRVRSRRRLSALAYATAASVFIAGVLGIWRPWNLERQSVVEVRGKTPMRSDDLAELPMLFEPPPVDSLDVLTRQQNGYVVALRRLGEE